MVGIGLLIIALVAVLICVSACKVASDADDAMPDTFTIEPPPETEPKPDVLLLAKIMQAEAGIDWPDWAVMLIGEVVMNRVASPQFPNTVKEVIYQRDGNLIQYEPVWLPTWDSIEPSQDYIDLAQRLWDGERAIGDPDMVWQSLFRQGERTLVTYYDRALDTTTYFCAG